MWVPLVKSHQVACNLDHQWPLIIFGGKRLYGQFDSETDHRGVALIDVLEGRIEGIRDGGWSSGGGDTIGGIGL